MINSTINKGKPVSCLVTYGFEIKVPISALHEKCQKMFLLSHLKLIRAIFHNQ